jgi:hypothetical protein
MIAVPTLGEIKSNCVMSIVNSLFEDRSNCIIKNYGHTTSSTISHARNTLCNNFLKTNLEWILFIDSDIDFSYNDIVNLYNKALNNNIKVISGCYFSYFGNEKIYPVSSIVNFDSDFEEVSWLGLGFTLIHRSILEKTGKDSVNGDKHWFAETYKNGTYVGEDMYFSNLLNENSIKLYVCPEIRLGHNKNKRISWEDYVKQN